MKTEEIVAQLEQKFGDKIKSKKLDALDPFVVVDAADLYEVEAATLLSAGGSFENARPPPSRVFLLGVA